MRTEAEIKRLLQDIELSKGSDYFLKYYPGKVAYPAYLYEIAMRDLLKWVLGDED